MRWMVRNDLGGGKEAWGEGRVHDDGKVGRLLISGDTGTGKGGGTYLLVERTGAVGATWWGGGGGGGKEEKVVQKKTGEPLCGGSWEKLESGHDGVPCRINVCGSTKWPKIRG